MAGRCEYIHMPIVQPYSCVARCKTVWADQPVKDSDTTMSQRNTNIKGTNPVDTYVGSRVKTRRLMLGLSQEELAKSIGLTFQQVQKYEKGVNRISVSRLMDISKALKVPFAYFLEGVAGISSQLGGAARLRGVSDTKQAPLEADPMMRKDVIELVRAYTSIETTQLQKQLLEMAKAMATSDKS